MEWYWWLLISVMYSCMLIFTVRILGLFHRPDFDMDESEWESGSVDIKRYNALHDAGRVCQQSNDNSE
jgi:hypothetical protein